MTVGKLRTERPVYEQGFTFLVSNPETDTIEFKVYTFVSCILDLDNNNNNNYCVNCFVLEYIGCGPKD